MNRYPNSVGVLVPRVMLPGEGADYSKWAVVACDQYTSQPEYWEKARAYIGGAPSTLDLILPEAYLGKPGEEEKIAAVKQAMGAYLEKGVLESKEQGFVLVKRTVGGNTRLGLILALDLECYDYAKGSETMIRATEGTIVERIPPRLRIREGAALELPHILVLIDDPKCSVIEPLEDKAGQLPIAYDTQLMLGGGHITGRMVTREKDVQGVLDALAALTDREAFRAKYGHHAPLLFAMGDGNHSFATAKAYWEQVKASIPESQRKEHPARYALVEIENVHDKGIVFEPIHRVVFGISGREAAEELALRMDRQNGSCRVDWEEALKPSGGERHVIPFFTGSRQGSLIVERPSAQLAVGTLQNAIDELIRENPSVSVDYIHGAEVVKELASKPGAIGFLLPAMGKAELFPTVIYDGALPRKTFSMGEANEKRYYMECRRIVK